MTLLPDPSVPLSTDAATQAFAAILDGQVADDAIARFLLLLADRGETAGEIAAAAAVMRARMMAIAAPADAIDVCGTGGDGAHSLNISTAVAFVVAAAGVPVAKHGNRAASSRSGAADVLAALGWHAELPLDRIEAGLAEVGIMFLHAQRHHPALARIAPIRRALGRRTIFNLLGPLANPARVKRQMVGVFAPQWLTPMAEAGGALGATDMLLLHGGGLDEVALHASTDMIRFGSGALQQLQFNPADIGVALRPLALLKGGDPYENALALKALMAGVVNTPQLLAYRDIVALNAAAALLLAGRVADMAMGYALATTLISDGAAADRLARFLAFR